VVWLGWCGIRMQAEACYPQIQPTASGKPFTVSINFITKPLSVIGKKKSVGPNVITREILKLGGEAMIP